MKPSQLPQAIDKIFSEYVGSLYTQIGAAAEDVGRETVEILKVSSPKKSGKYAKSWRLKRWENGRVIKVTVYNTRFQLTHLLENGHATRGGTGRTAAFPHIAPAEKTAAERFEQKIKLEVGANK